MERSDIQGFAAGQIGRGFRFAQFGLRVPLRPRSHIQLSYSQVSSTPGLVGLGVCPSLFPSPERGGVARQSRRGRRKRACPARHRLFPLSRSTVPGPGPALSSRRGLSGVRPGVQLRTTPAGAGPAPPSRRLARRPSMDGTRMTYGESHPKSIRQWRCEQSFGILQARQFCTSAIATTIAPLWPGGFCSFLCRRLDTHQRVLRPATMTRAGHLSLDRNQRLVHGVAASTPGAMGTYDGYG